MSSIILGFSVFEQFPVHKVNDQQSATRTVSVFVNFLSAQKKNYSALAELDNQTFKRMTGKYAVITVRMVFPKHSNCNTSNILEEMETFGRNSTRVKPIKCKNVFLLCVFFFIVS